MPHYPHFFTQYLFSVPVLDFKTSLHFRYILLEIVSTFLMKPPIITEFGVYGATFECVHKNQLVADIFLIPCFVFFCTIMCIIIIADGIQLEKIRRWKVNF